MRRGDDDGRFDLHEPDQAPDPNAAAEADGAEPPTPDLPDLTGGTLLTPKSISCSYTQWWNAYITHQSYSYGWRDTDLSVRSWSGVQLRHASRLVRWGVYAWGYVPEFVDTVTGYRFRFLHLHPTAKRATIVNHVYPSGYVVGYSGGNTYDTGYPRYSSGAHLCVQTISAYRSVFPYGRNTCY